MDSVADITAIAGVASVAALGKVPFRHWRVLVGVADIAVVAYIAV